MSDRLVIDPLTVANIVGQLGSLILAKKRYADVQFDRWLGGFFGKTP
jgi:hypothetical protein